ncbi:MAG TPA: VOC family protein [Polyangia bacterium]|jgi:catechol 2,3-dioxygenase-like lactoylglutathione lyase family enzyme|nr:VOC family protein [Polyangia bacterium]
MDMKLEVVVLPVSDVDRAKRFYERLGWRLDADFARGPDFRVVQFTPPGSATSIHFGKGLTPTAPGTLQNLYLVVYDIQAARADLVGRGVSVSEIFHKTPATDAGPGPDPERQSYASFATFEDPDGNGWLLQEIRQRLPGRGGEPTAPMLPEPEVTQVLVDLLRRAEQAHGAHEKELGRRDEDWPQWYGAYMNRTLREAGYQLSGASTT